MTSTPDTSTTAGKIADLRNRLAETRTPVGEDAIRALHESGRVSARERVELLLDEGSFVETDALARHRSTAFGANRKRPVTDGIVAGHGTVDGRPVCVFSQDSTIFDGQLGETAGEKILKVAELALKSGTPLVGIYDGAGARVKEGMAALEYFTRIYRLQSQASGVIPQIAIVAGPTSAAQAHGVSLADVVIEVADHGHVQLDVAGAGSTAADAAHGLAHLVAADDEAAVALAADVLGFFPSNNRAVPMPAEAVDPAADASSLDSLVPDSDATAYDIRHGLDHVVDAGSLLELQPQFAPNIITAFARVAGRSVGLVANQPEHLAGALDADATEKAARFIRTCDTFNIPVVTFVDCPGFAPDEEDALLVRRSAKLLGATANASVGLISVVTRKAFGSAYLALGAKKMGTDLVFAWPTAQIAVADAETISEAVGKDVDTVTELLVNPYAAAERGLVDAVIPPRETRQRISEGLRLLERKISDGFDRKHENLPF
ncbi:MAG TPA: acyl-CoA carboxylase subunit beta [Candidatus Corynebacterium gallistercoris]|uniref:Acyl-CoA carboxylase subunit beta n=1 Tax=Candidatus Corynebacterium gallistercoris TaxID=2838530 RepID=A0A9D1RZF2_9CORY|nr:acyl-CoA carboxylase subunit beta [Candidatus Corynebacterium gallistercoris]